jgi:hypothetical protein
MVVVMMILMVVVVDGPVSLAFQHLHLAARLFASFVRRLLIMGRLIMWHVGRRTVAVADGKKYRGYDDRSVFAGNRLWRRSLIVPEHSTERTTFHDITVGQYVRCGGLWRIGCPARG